MTRPTLAPVFLVGCARSGTTLLQRLLDAHSAIAIAPETHFVRRFCLQRDARGSLDDGQVFERLIDEVVAMPEFADMRLDAAQFRQAAAGIERTYGAVFELLLRSFQELRGVRIVGEKTPNHVRYMRTLEEFFPNARFVHIVRDPRAVVNSWRSVPWSTGTVSGDARRWRLAIRAAWEGPPHSRALHVVHYERLVVNPEKELRAICRFLEIAFEPAMLAYHERPADTIDFSREPWKKGAGTAVYRNSIDSWAHKLSASDVAEIEAQVWREMVWLGYRPQIGRLVKRWVTARVRPGAAAPPRPAPRKARRPEDTTDSTPNR